MVICYSLINGGTMKLEELQVYQLAMEMAEKIWIVVINWNYFEKDTVGITIC